MQFSVRAHRIVKLDEVGNRLLQFLRRVIIVVGNLLTLHDAEKRLGDSVVMRSAGIGKRLRHAMFAEIHPESMRCVLQSLIAMKSQTGWPSTVFIRLSKCGKNKSGIVAD